MLFFVLENYVSRQCAQLTKVLEDMEGHVVRFVGPVNTGKTMTLAEAYYLALSQNKKAYYFDLQYLEDDIGNITDDTHIFVDNAQIFREKSSHLSHLASCQNLLCLAYSGKAIGPDGLISYQNKRIKASREFLFTPFSQNEWEEYKRISNIDWRDDCERTYIPGYLRQSANLDKYDQLVLSEAKAVFCRLHHSPEVRNDNADELVYHIYNCIFSAEGIPQIASWKFLERCGLAYDRDGKYNFVYGISIINPFTGTSAYRRSRMT